MPTWARARARVCVGGGGCVEGGRPMCVCVCVGAAVSVCVCVCGKRVCALGGGAPGRVSGRLSSAWGCHGVCPDHSST